MAGDRSKTKEQLIKELSAARRRVKRLETARPKATRGARKRPPTPFELDLVTRSRGVGIVFFRQSRILYSNEGAAALTGFTRR